MGAEQPSLAVVLVRALMERHGLPKYRQSAWLADALGLSYSQAHRRMTGASPWSLEDLSRVAALFGETMSDVVSAGSVDQTVAGSFSVGTLQVPCRLSLGPRFDRSRPNQLVAVPSTTGWLVVQGREAGDAGHVIERLEARPSSDMRKVIAVLDDDPDITNSICEHFESSGYEARPFFGTAELLASLAHERFDGFLIDWIVGETSTVGLIKTIRDQDAKCPIVVLTAQVLAGLVDEADIAAAVNRYALVFSEKPVRASILAATLNRAFVNG